MTKMTLNRAAATGLALILAIGLGGCKTVSLESLTSCDDPIVGYWSARVTGSARLQKIYGDRIAAVELKKRKRSVLGKTMPELRDYRNELLAPVTVSTTYSRTGRDLKTMPDEQVRRLDSYIAHYAAAQRIEGAAYSRDWSREAERIATAMRELGSQISTILDSARSKLAAGNIAAAAAQWELAAVLDHDGTDVIEVQKTIIAEKAKLNLPALIEGNMKTLTEARKIQKDVFGSSKSSAVDLKRCLTLVGKVDNAVKAFNDDLRALSGELVVPEEIRADLESLEQRVASLLGLCWREQVYLHRAAKDYWAAYEYVRTQNKNLAGLPVHRKAVMKDELWEGYSKMLAPGMAFYVNEANRHFDQDAYGISLVFCRMAEEMIQFARDNKITVPVQAVEWEKRSRLTRVDAQDKVSSAMNRRILIADFTPRTVETDALEDKVYQQCSTLLTGSANTDRIAWGVTVGRYQQGNKTGKSDYLVDCSISDFHVIDEPPIEKQRSIVKVHREVNQIANPDYNAELNPKVPMMMFAQELYLYQKITKMHFRKARINLSASYSHMKHKRQLLFIDREFSDDDTDLDGVNLTSIEESLDVPFVGPPRKSFNRSELTVDSWPVAVVPNLSSELAIRNAMQKYAAEAIVARTVSLVDRFPVDSLASEALKNHKLGNSYEAANHWGQCLEYCFRLVNENRSGASAVTWIEQKDKMLRRLGELGTTRWRDSEGEVLAKVSDLWSVSVNAALAVVSK